MTSPFKGKIESVCLKGITGKLKGEPMYLVVPTNVKTNLKRSGMSRDRSGSMAVVGNRWAMTHLQVLSSGVHPVIEGGTVYPKRPTTYLAEPPRAHFPWRLPVGLAAVLGRFLRAIRRSKDSESPTC